MKKGTTFMKKLFSIVAVAALTTAVPAFASTLDINLSGTNVNQLQDGAVTQGALSAAVAVGNVGNYSDVTSTAVDGAQMANVDQTISQVATYNVNAVSNNVNQHVNGAVGQLSASLAGSGSIADHSSVASTAASLGQNAGVTVRIKQ